jgi:Flp pilus assembly pilin Flp
MGLGIEYGVIWAIVTIVLVLAIFVVGFWLERRAGSG